MMRSLVFLVVAGLSGAASAAEGVDCATIEDPQSRLACFDDRFPKEPRATDAVDAKVSSTAPTEAATSSAASDVSSGSPPPAQSPSPPQSSPARVEANTEEDVDAKPRKSLFGNDPELTLRSAIVEIGGSDSQNMVFLLDNNQIWMQTVPRRLPFRVGDVIVVKNGYVGGYYMSTEKGTTTRVKRIK